MSVANKSVAKYTGLSVYLYSTSRMQLMFSQRLIGIGGKVSGHETRTFARFDRYGLC